MSFRPLLLFREEALAKALLTSRAVQTDLICSSLLLRLLLPINNFCATTIQPGWGKQPQCIPALITTITPPSYVFQSIFLAFYSVWFYLFSLSLISFFSPHIFTATQRHSRHSLQLCSPAYTHIQRTNHFYLSVCAWKNCVCVCVVMCAMRASVRLGSSDNVIQQFSNRPLPC